MGSLRKSIWRFAVIWGEDVGLSALLPLFFFIFFVLPLFSPGLADRLTSVLFSLVLLAGVAGMSGSLVVRGLAGAVVAVALLLRWLERVFPQPGVIAASTLSSLVFLTLLTFQVLLRAFRRGPVTAHRVRGAVAAYFLLGVCWALVYQLIDLRLPGAFAFAAGEGSRTSRDANLVYFSFITLTTLGYGDITAVHPVARMLVVLEALIGQLYPATLLARLVSLEITHRVNEPAAGPPGAGSGGAIPVSEEDPKQS